MTEIVLFGLLYAVHAILTGYVMRAINGHFLYGVLLGVCAALLSGWWLATMLGLADWPKDTTRLMVSVAAVVSGLPFFLAYHKVRPTLETLAGPDAERIRTRRSRTAVALLLLIGWPVIGIVVCAWFLLFRMGDFFPARS